MDMTLTKFIAILVICDTTYVAGIPIKETPYGYINAKDKRSTLDNFSLFGIGIKTPFSVTNPVRETYNSFKNLFRPAPNLFQDGSIIREQTLNSPQHNNGINSMKPTTDKPHEIGSTHNNDVSKNFELTSSPNMKTKNKEALPENINYTRSNHELKENKGLNNDTKLVPKIQKAGVNSDHVQVISSTSTKATNEFTAQNEKKESEGNADQKLLEYIFTMNENGLIDTTTESETGDFTTECGDYNTTTIYNSDDLLRIPAPIVASLLG